MSINETMTLDSVRNVIPFKDALEGWKWVGTTLKEVIEKDHETIHRQNEGFMNLIENPETTDSRYEDASEQIREIREYKKEMTIYVIKALTVVTLALCGVKTINISR